MRYSPLELCHRLTRDAQRFPLLAGGRCEKRRIGRTNSDASILDRMPTGSYIGSRIVPVHDDWLLSGTTALYLAHDQARAYSAAVRLAAEQPALVYHHPQRLAHAWDLQRAQHAVTGKPALTWREHGEQVLRKHKAEWYTRNHLPSLTIFSDRLAAHVRAGYPEWSQPRRGPRRSIG